MPAGDPVLPRGPGDRQLVGDDLKNGDPGTGHAPDCSPAPGRCAPRRSPPRRRPMGSASAANTGTPPDHRGVRPMSRLMRDLSSGTYVLNPDTFSRSHESPAAAGLS